MKTAVVSYSYTGNNEKIAVQIARQLSCDHIRVVPKRPVSMGSILLDLLLNRVPAVQPEANTLDQYGFTVLVAPVWMGMVAFPMRAILTALQKAAKPYAFVSLSGGADGVNPKLEAELTKRTGVQPTVFLDMHIRDLLTDNPNPERKDTSAYRVTDAEAARLAATAAEQLANGLATLS